MGFHICAFCDNDSGNIFSRYSSGDTNLTFTNGHRWVMPDMILHYIADHYWQPLQEFIDDVMTGKLAVCERRQTRGMSVSAILDATKVGYLANEEFTFGPVPNGFVEKLEALMKQADGMDMRVQTKGVVYR